MSKRRYKSEEFKNVDWDRVEGRIEGERVVLAVDVAKEDFVATLLDREQEALQTFHWCHPQETAEVLERMLRLGQGRRLEAVLEPSSTCGDALLWQLRQAGIAVYRVSPKRVHDAAEVYDGVPSLHDAKAAYLIGRLHLQGISQPWQEPSEERRELKALQTRLCGCKEREQGARNRLEAHLSRHWPESLCILGLGSATLAALIAWTSLSVVVIVVVVVIETAVGNSDLPHLVVSPSEHGEHRNNRCPARAPLVFRGALSSWHLCMPRPHT
jgi:transposase